MSGGARANIPNDSAMQTDVVFVPNQLAASTTRFINAQSITAAAAGTEYAVASPVNPNIGGRNAVLTQVEAAGATLAAVYEVHGFDQFGNPVVENTGTVASSATWTGTKIFQRVTKLKVVSISNPAASDTVSLGDGDKVGIHRMFSADLAELIGASLINAAGTTVTAKTVNTTNFDTTYFACKAALFGGTVTAGDSVAIAYRGTCRTPDDTSRFPARS